MGAHIEITTRFTYLLAKDCHSLGSLEWQASDERQLLADAEVSLVFSMCVRLCVHSICLRS